MGLGRVTRHRELYASGFFFHLVSGMVRYKIVNISPEKGFEQQEKHQISQTCYFISLEFLGNPGTVGHDEVPANFSYWVFLWWGG
jgi:hypothetical protein